MGQTSSMSSLSSASSISQSGALQTEAPHSRSSSSRPDDSSSSSSTPVYATSTSSSLTHDPGIIFLPLKKHPLSNI